MKILNIPHKFQISLLIFLSIYVCVCICVHVRACVYGINMVLCVCLYVWTYAYKGEVIFSLCTYIVEVWGWWKELTQLTHWGKVSQSSWQFDLASLARDLVLGSPCMRCICLNIQVGSGNQTPVLSLAWKVL